MRKRDSKQMHGAFCPSNYFKILKKYMTNYYVYR